MRDQIRQDGNEPLQSMYEAANCRIYYTLANAYNMSRLWRDAASATWDDPSLCVEGSTGYASTGNTTIAKNPPPGTDAKAGYHALSATNAGVKVSYNGDLPDGRASRMSGVLEPCSNSCPGGCSPVSCRQGVDPVQACLPACLNVGGSCNGDGDCRANNFIETKQRTAAGKSGVRNIVQGKCHPKFGTALVGCPA